MDDWASVPENKINRWHVWKTFFVQIKTKRCYGDHTRERLSSPRNSLHCSTMTAKPAACSMLASTSHERSRRGCKYVLFTSVTRWQPIVAIFCCTLNYCLDRYEHVVLMPLLFLVWVAPVLISPPVIEEPEWDSGYLVPIWVNKTRSIRNHSEEKQNWWCHQLKSIFSY